MKRKSTILKSLKKTGLLILLHFIPVEILSVHHNIDPGIKHLNKSQRAPQVEEPIGGGAKGIRDHGSGEHDGLVFQSRCFR